jgi:hypothetical protein
MALTTARRAMGADTGGMTARTSSSSSPSLIQHEECRSIMATIAMYCSRMPRRDCLLDRSNPQRRENAQLGRYRDSSGVPFKTPLR